MHKWKQTDRILLKPCFHRILLIGVEPTIVSNAILPSHIFSHGHQVLAEGTPTEHSLPAVTRGKAWEKTSLQLSKSTFKDRFRWSQRAKKYSVSLWYTALRCLQDFTLLQRHLMHMIHLPLTKSLPACSLRSIEVSDPTCTRAHS